MARAWDGIFFLLDGQQFAFRAWDRVPRLGEWVVFAPDDKPYKVDKVLWRENRSPPDAAYAEVVLRRIR